MGMQQPQMGGMGARLEHEAATLAPRKGGGGGVERVEEEVANRVSNRAEPRSSQVCKAVCKAACKAEWAVGCKVEWVRA